MSTVLQFSCVRVCECVLQLLIVTVLFVQTTVNDRVTAGPLRESLLGAHQLDPRTPLEGELDPTVVVGFFFWVCENVVEMKQRMMPGLWLSSLNSSVVL